jgi:hypothetical protein
MTGIVLTLVACGDDADPSTTTDSVQSSTTVDGVTTTVGEGAEATLSDLTGTWENVSLSLEVNDGGEFLVMGGPNEPLMGGFIARDGAQFNFVTSTTGECPGQTGVYEASIEDDVLTLSLIEDPCQLRATGFEPAFARSD